MAPELHFPKHFGLDAFKQTYASDIYAFACTCLEVRGQIWAAITAKIVSIRYIHFHHLFLISEMIWGSLWRSLEVDDPVDPRLGLDA